MCDICGYYRCPGSCPGSEAEMGEACAECGQVVVAGEYCYERDGRFYHSECVESIERHTLIRQAGFVETVADYY